MDNIAIIAVALLFTAATCVAMGITTSMLSTDYVDLQFWEELGLQQGSELTADQKQKLHSWLMFHMRGGRDLSEFPWYVMEKDSTDSAHDFAKKNPSLLEIAAGVLASIDERIIDAVRSELSDYYRDRVCLFQRTNSKERSVHSVPYALYEGAAGTPFWVLKTTKYIEATNSIIEMWFLRTIEKDGTKRTVAAAHSLHDLAYFHNLKLFNVMYRSRK